MLCSKTEHRGGGLTRRKLKDRRKSEGLKTKEKQEKKGQKLVVHR